MQKHHFIITYDPSTRQPTQDSLVILAHKPVIISLTLPPGSDQPQQDRFQTLQSYVGLTSWQQEPSVRQ